MVQTANALKVTELFVSSESEKRAARNTLHTGKYVLIALSGWHTQLPQHIGTPYLQPLIHGILVSDPNTS